MKLLFRRIQHKIGRLIPRSLVKSNMPVNILLAMIITFFIFPMQTVRMVRAVWAWQVIKNHFLKTLGKPSLAALIPYDLMLSTRQKMEWARSIRKSERRTN